MEFGLFVQAHVPRHEMEADPVGAEHRAPDARARARGSTATAHGWKYVWSVEHHFLEEYSHISASEIFLPYVAARTKRIHVGSAIYNITPPVNHPARIAERVAMLDHLSEGPLRVRHRARLVEHRVQGLRHPRRRHHARDVRRVAARDPAHVARDARTATTASTSRCPSATCCRSRTRCRTRRSGSPAAARRPSRRPARLGLGALCFSLGSPKDFEPLIKVYKDTIKHAEPVGDYVNDNVACVTQLVCLEDGKQAREVALSMGSGYHTSLVFRYLDTFPRPAGVPAWPQLIPEPTAGAARRAHRIRATHRRRSRRVRARRCSSMPTSAAISSSSASSPRRSRRTSALRSVELFGKHVIPRFDKDPVHSTTRMREAAAAQGRRQR